MANLPVLVSMCVIKPSFSLMEKAYDDYRTDKHGKEASHPCQAKIEGKAIKNQCAVRMSLALERCGFDLTGFPKPSRVHRNRSVCGISPAGLGHVLGAEELANYLKSVWGVDQEFKGTAFSKKAAASIAGQNGIIYFNNCFDRNGGGGPRTGDHIDLWYGALNKYFNQIMNIPAGHEDQASAQPLFEKSDRIWFFKLN